MAEKSNMSMGTVAGTAVNKILLKSHSSTTEESPLCGGELKDNNVYKQDSCTTPVQLNRSTVELPCKSEVHESNDSKLLSIANIPLVLDESTSAAIKGINTASEVQDTSLVVSCLVDQFKAELTNSIIERETVPGVMDLGNLHDGDVARMKLHRDGSLPYHELPEHDDSSSLSSGNYGTSFELKEHYEVRVERRDSTRSNAEKSALQADDIERYATSISNRRMPLRVSATFNHSKESADFNATVTSPSDDFHSIYACNNECTFAVAPTSELQCPVRSAVPPVYLPNSDAWVDVAAPVNAVFPLRSFCVRRRTAWCVDRSDHLFSAVLRGPGVQWVSIDQSAQLMSCSPDGHIIWRLCCGSAYAASRKIGAKSSAGLEWREIARDVAHLSVDNNMAWYGIFCLLVLLHTTMQYYFHLSDSHAFIQ